jgi:altronate dehydratase large subunit
MTNRKMTFWGYRRPDGRVGVRNHILILPASVCASDTTRIIASQVNGAVTFNNQNGCSQVPSDLQLTLDVMSGFAANPNIYGTIVVALGCENAQADLVVSEIKKRTNKPLKKLVIQEEGGTLKTIEKAVRYAKEMAAEASLLQREEFPMSELIIGTECGGSDTTSGLAANPAIGSLSDKIVELGGTSILSETTELIGAEHILAKRAKNEEVKRRIYEIIERYEKSLELVGEKVREGNPSPGNKAGGLTTLEEKSLGCIHKGGTTTINAVYDYAKDVTEKGLVIMDTPGNDPSSVAGMVAGGCQIVVFSTGRGTPTGNPIVPVIKITGNRETYNRMKDNIDVDCSGFIFGEQTLDELGEILLKEVQEVASGKLTKAEQLGYMEIAIMRAANYV